MFYYHNLKGLILAISSLTHGLFRRVLFNFQVVRDIPDSFRLGFFWLESIPAMISVLLNLLGFNTAEYSVLDGMKCGKM
jgi:hypothetical protein